MAADSGTYDQATIARRQKIAEAMLGDAMKPQKIEHWAQGLAQLGRAGIGGYMSHQANEDAKAEEYKQTADLYKAAGLPPPPTPEASPSIFSRVASAMSGGGQPAPETPVAAPAGPQSDQASYPPPPAAGPAPTTFRPGIAAPGGAPDYSKAIAGIESGGAYDKLGPQTRTGDRAYGKYQVMGANVPEWTEQVLGKRMTPDQFLSNPDAQEAVFKAKFGDYAQKYGPEGAAKAWFAGEKGMNNPNARDVLGTTVEGYGKKFTNALGPQAPVAQAMAAPQMPTQPPYQVPGPPTAAPQSPVAQAMTPSTRPGPSGMFANVPKEKLPAILQGLTSKNPTMKALAVQELGNYTKADVQTVDLGNKVAIMDKRGNVLREISKGEPNKGPQWADTGEIDPQTGQPVKGWVNPSDKSVTPHRPQGAVPAQPSTVPPVPPGVDPKVWREAQSKRATEEGMPASGEVTSKLRNEIQGLPSYKNLAQAAPVYRAMNEAAGRDNRAADLNLIYGFGKIMDPGSVVRESEMTMAEKINTLPQYLRATAESQLSGSGRLSPEVRAQILAEAHTRIQSYKGMFDQDAGMYRGIAKRGRMNEEDVIPSFGEFTPWTPPKAVAPAGGPQKTKSGVTWSVE